MKYHFHVSKSCKVTMPGGDQIELTVDDANESNSKIKALEDELARLKSGYQELHSLMRHIVTPGVLKNHLDETGVSLSMPTYSHGKPIMVSPYGYTDVMGVAIDSSLINGSQ